jgi:hypothetical protein
VPKKPTQWEVAPSRDVVPENPIRPNWRIEVESAHHPGRCAREVRDLIRRMSFENPLWGATKIHGELLKLGIGAAQSTVSTYMVPRN